MSKIFIFLINIYQQVFSFDRGILAVLAPGGACKYQISCSEYTKRVISEHGVAIGVWLGAKRVWSCR